MLSSTAVRTVGAGSVAHRATIQAAVYQSRRWKRHMPCLKIRPQNLDLDDLLVSPLSDGLHNPFKSAIIDKKERISEAKAKEAQAFAQYVPQNRGSHPLSLENEYMGRNIEFLHDHGGIKLTPTRAYYDVVDLPEFINKKNAFGIVKIFQAFRTTKDEYHDKRSDDAKYIGEFDFAKPKWMPEDYMAHLDLYVRMLYTLPVEKRQPYFRDFFLIIKAIRQRPKMHGRFIELTLFKRHIMAYFLVAGQSNLALCVAVDLVLKAVPESLSRWTLVRLLGLEHMYNTDMVLIKDLSAVREGEKPSRALSDREYRYNMLVHAILAYYYERPDVHITDLEIVRLIRCIEARELAGDLMDMLPIVLRRFAAGATKKLPTADLMELYYETKAIEWEIGDSQLVMRYALAFVRVEQVDRAVKILTTVADMPPKSIPNVRGTTCQVASAISNLALCGSRESENLVVTTLELLSRNTIEPSPSAPLSLSEYKANLVESVVASMLDWKLEQGYAITRLLVSIVGRLAPFTVMAITQRLYQQDGTLALSWVAQQLFDFDSAAHDKVLKWIGDKLNSNKKLLPNFIKANSVLAPVATARLVHVLSRREWKLDGTHQTILSQAFSDIVQTNNAQAIGMLLTSAALGPDTSVLSQFGPQTPQERASSVVKLIGSIKPTTKDLRQLMSYLIKVAGLLRARDSERMLWREILRCGIEPNWRMMQAGLALRLSQRYDVPGALELILHILCEAPSLESNFATMQAGQQQQLPSPPNDGEDSDQQQAEFSEPINGPSAYLAILDGLNRSGMVEPMEQLAEYLLDSKQLSNRTFGAVAAVWLDGIGFNEKATRDDVQRVWRTLQDYTGDKGAKKHGREANNVYQLNRNHYNSAIEACVRKGDVDAAWYLLHVEMREDGLMPDLKTFHTLVSPLATSNKLWPIGKSTVAKFNVHYPEIVKEALSDGTNTLPVRALLHHTMSK
ncbi:hypothetical protein GGI19_000676 [Coemansia pectinata]|uniref:Uncharacterized protein n=1 Tax=Coemansia pectinata TaxID=1052879 RepID=A0A9W8H4Z1_9FUNG|nr:hypothetical protein GGI19_000676 [Coemansia pectinata]